MTEELCAPRGPGGITRCYCTASGSRSIWHKDCLYRNASGRRQTLIASSGSIPEGRHEFRPLPKKTKTPNAARGACPPASRFFPAAGARRPAQAVSAPAAQPRGYSRKRRPRPHGRRGVELTVVLLRRVAEGKATIPETFSLEEIMAQSFNAAELIADDKKYV